MGSESKMSPLPFAFNNRGRNAARGKDVEGGIALKKFLVAMVGERYPTPPEITNHGGVLSVAGVAWGRHRLLVTPKQNHEKRSNRKQYNVLNFNE